MTAPLMRPVEEIPVRRGVQQVYRLPNGYGASLIVWDTGLCEMRVTRCGRGRAFRIDHGTPLEAAVLGVRGEDEVQNLLDRIRALPYGGAS